MLAANSYQMTLLTGQNYQDNIQLYVLGGIFLAASFVWYALFRWKPSVYVLSAPWLFFGIAFFLIAVPSLSPSLARTHTIISDIATWSYAISSAASFVFFGLNFGEEAVSHLCRLRGVSDLPDFDRVLPRRSGRCVRVSYRVRSKSGSRPCGIGEVRSTRRSRATSHRGGSRSSSGLCRSCPLSLPTSCSVASQVRTVRDVGVTSFIDDVC